MKNLMLLSLGLLLIATACDKDNLDFDYDPGKMHYDGANANSPILPVGTNEAAARFSSDVLDLYEGKEIEKVDVFIYGVPDHAELVIYGPGSNGPGNVIVEKDITTQIDSFSWNRIELDTPLAIPSSGDLWIAIRMTQTSNIQVIGCDAGPNKDGGDWLYQESDGQWRKFKDRSPVDNINWNIRAVIY